MRVVLRYILTRPLYFGLPYGVRARQETARLVKMYSRTTRFNV